jgi:putative transcriptional regulator
MLQLALKILKYFILLLLAVYFYGMNIHEGCIIQSTDVLNNDYFANSLIFIIQHSHKGTIGFVLNKKTRKKSTINQQHFSIFCGGPVTQNTFNVLHDMPLNIVGAIHIHQGIYWNNNVDANFLSSLKPPSNNIKILQGYCGWDANELEQEYIDGCWKIINTTKSLIFEV